MVHAVREALGRERRDRAPPVRGVEQGRILGQGPPPVARQGREARILRAKESNESDEARLGEATQQNLG